MHWSKSVASGFTIVCLLPARHHDIIYTLLMMIQFLAVLLALSLVSSHYNYMLMSSEVFFFSSLEQEIRIFIMLHILFITDSEYQSFRVDLCFGFNDFIVWINCFVFG